jgi:hypothetical protein
MRRLVAVILVAQLLGGCSFVLVSGPPSNHQQLPVVDCTTSRLGPILDTVWTILQTINFSVAASRSEQEWNDSFDGDPPLSHSTAIPVYAGLALLGGAGMYYGFSRTGACRAAKNEAMMRGMGGPQPGPGTWPPPAAPAAPAPAAPAPAAPAPPAPAAPAPPASAPAAPAPAPPT